MSVQEMRSAAILRAIDPRAKRVIKQERQARLGAEMEQEQRARTAAYLHEPVICPRCAASEFEPSGIEDGTGQAWQHCECHACGAKWTEIYTLTSIEFEEEGEE
jgi:transposase-like protein